MLKLDDHNCRSDAILDENAEFSLNVLDLNLNKIKTINYICFSKFGVFDKTNYAIRPNQS